MKWFKQSILLCASLFPFESLFYILLNDDMIANDVVPEHFSFNSFLTTFFDERVEPSFSLAGKCGKTGFWENVCV